jgi:CheY-like chemotaxis protein
MVEDDPKDVELTLTALEEYNLANEVVVATDGEEALDYLYHRGKFQARGNGNPAVLLLDLKLPKVDGLSVLRTLKADQRTRWMPVIVLTSSKEVRDSTACNDLGVNSYVQKPVDVEHSREAVDVLALYWLLVNQSPPRHAMAKGTEKSA